MMRIAWREQHLLSLIVGLAPELPMQQQQHDDEAAEVADVAVSSTDI